MKNNIEVRIYVWGGKYTTLHVCSFVDSVKTADKLIKDTKGKLGSRFAWSIVKRKI